VYLGRDGATRGEEVGLEGATDTVEVVDVAGAGGGLATDVGTGTGFVLDTAGAGARWR